VATIHCFKAPHFMSDQAASDETPRKSNMGLILGIVGVLVLGAAGGAWFMFGGKSSAEGEAPRAVAKLPPQFVELDPPFVVNFQPGSSARFLQIAVQLMTRDPQTVAKLEHLAPIIRNDLLLLFGNKSVAEVSSPEAKEALRDATLAAVRKVIESEDGRPESLEAVYFTSFVMQ
jgi:flagellar FliL protein